MDNGLERINSVHELAQSGADADVVHKFVREVEKQFLEEATLLTQNAQYEQAIGKYLLATSLPGRPDAREDVISRILYVLSLSMQDGKGIDQIEDLKDTRFSTITAELKRRLDNEDYRKLNEKLSVLDGERSLLNKDFNAIKKILAEMPSPKTEHHYAIELRLVGEEKAKEIWFQIISALHSIAEQSEFEERRKLFDTSIRELERQAIGYAGDPEYCEQIRRYVSEAERELIDSHTETAINQIHHNSTDRSYREFIQFKETVSTGEDEVTILESICKALRAFRDDSLYVEVERVAVEWVSNDGKIRYQLKAVKDPRAIELIDRSLELVCRNGGHLPKIISEEFCSFLNRLKNELNPPPEVTTEQSAAQPPPVQQPRGLKAWLASFFSWRQDK